MKKILKVTGYLLSFLLPKSIVRLFDGIRTHIYTGYKSKTFSVFGKNSIIRYSVEIGGEGDIICGNNTDIGRWTVITAWGNNSKIHIGNNVAIGEDCHITAINKIIIGNGVLFGKKITITDNSHGNIDYENLQIPPLKRAVVSKGAVIIKDRVWIGDKATILPNVTIGEGAIIGSNAVVTKDIPDYCVAAGNPAKIIKEIRKI